MTTNQPANAPRPSLAPIDLQSVTALYRRFAFDLIAARRRLASLKDRTPGSRWLFWRRPDGPAFDDLDAEIAYLLVRELRPRTVVEIARGGWSSAWILSALRDNGIGALHSFHFSPESAPRVPDELAQGRHCFVPGDVRQKLDALPAPIDWLSVEVDRSARFAHWVFEKLLPRLDDGTPVAIRGVFGVDERGDRRTGATVVLERIAAQSTPYFTATPSRAPETLARLMELRAELGIGERVRRGVTTVHFRHRASEAPQSNDDCPFLD